MTRAKVNSHLAKLERMLEQALAFQLIDGLVTNMAVGPQRTAT